MAKQSQGKKALSRSILDMKFMQKSKEAAFKEAEEAEGRAVCGWSALTVSNVMLEPSFVACESLMSPRQSYHGFNPEIESLLESEKEQKVVFKSEIDAEIQAAEVARVTHAGHKLQPPRKKARFLKPKNDDD